MQIWSYLSYLVLFAGGHYRDITYIHRQHRQKRSREEHPYITSVHRQVAYKTTDMGQWNKFLCTVLWCGLRLVTFFPWSIITIFIIFTSLLSSLSNILSILSMLSFFHHLHLFCIHLKSPGVPIFGHFKIKSNFHLYSM